MVAVHRVSPEAYADQAAVEVARIATACRTGDGRDPLDEAARLHLQHHGLRDADLWLSKDGFALVRSTPGQRHLDLAVAPSSRRQGAGLALLHAVLAEPGAGAILAWSHGDHPGAAALAAGSGFERARALQVLRRPLDLAESGDAPDLRIRTFQPEDTPELLRVNAAAFAEHPEQGAMDAANLAERMAEPWFDPAGLLVADSPDGGLAGFHWTKVHETGHGEIYVLGIDPAAQGRGLGGALTRAGLTYLASRGCTRVHLYVEASNAAAQALYAGQGFTLDHTHVQYRRPAG